MSTESNATAASQDHKHAQRGLSPEIKAAVSICGVKPYLGLDEKAIIDEVTRQIDAAKTGDMSRAIGLLAGQAEALDVLFYNLLSKSQRAEEREGAAVLLGMALKAQEGCRSALEGLATIQK